MPPRLRVNISQVIEAQLFPVFDVEGHLGTWIAPPGPEAPQFLGLDGKGHLANLRGTNCHGCIAVAVVVNIQTGKDARRPAVKLRLFGFRVRESEREGPELAVGSSDLPVALTPMDD